MKAKLKIWLLILGICFAVTYGKDFLIDFFSDKTIHKTVATDTTDVNLNLKLNNKYENLTLEPTNNIQTADYIIANHSEEVVYDGYIKLDSYLYSPFVFIGNNSIFSNNEGFLVNDKEKNSRYSKELAYILLGFEADMTWEEIGITNKYIGYGKNKEKINIIIPYKRSPYYEYIKELFILCLNDFNEPTIEEYNVLLPRVLLILDKCDKVEDSGQFLYQNYKTNETDSLNGLLLTPESIISDNKDGFNHSALNSPRYSIITPITTTSIYYDVYINNNKTEELDDIELFKKLMNNESDFMVNTGLRSIEMNMDILSNKYLKGSLINLKSFQYDFDELNLNYSNYLETLKASEIINESNQEVIQEVIQEDNQEAIEKESQVEKENEIPDENELEQKNVNPMLIIIVILGLFILLIMWFVC